MEKELMDQVAVVTGGNSGIGRAIAIDLAKQGAKVMILARNEEKNEETKNKIIADGGYAESYKVDVADKTTVDSAVNVILNKYDRVDILICNAGNTTNPSSADKMPMEDFDSLMKTHIYGTMNSIQACVPKMKERKYGRIILLSSTGGYHGMAGNANYSVAKHGLVGLMYTLAKELGRFGITVNALQPGVIRTPMCDTLIDTFNDSFIGDTPVARVGTPEDVSYITTCLCSPKAGFITGVPLRVDGGYLIESGMDRLMLGFLG